MLRDTIRCSSDTSIAENLLENRSVKAVLERRKLAPPSSTRRNLLATALKLSPAVAPEVFSILDRCREVLEVEDAVEMYVFASPQYNAACTRPENGRVFILLSSSLLEAFERNELTFVVGHELGHHVYRHHDLPLELLHQKTEKVTPQLALKFLAWQRYAEISADRAGLACAGDFQAAATSLFKLSSGLTQTPTAERIAAYVEQASELYAEVDAAEQPVRHRDWLASHPFSPVRLSAAEVFSRTLPMGGTVPMARAEEQVHEFLAMMEPAYMEEDSPEAESMRRVVFAAGVAVAAATKPVTDDEVERLRELLGPKRVPNDLKPDAIIADLPRRVERARDVVRAVRRAVVVRDVASVARADGFVSEAEIAVVHQLAADLGVDSLVVDNALNAVAELD